MGSNICFAGAAGFGGGSSFRRFCICIEPVLSRLGAWTKLDLSGAGWASNDMRIDVSSVILGWRTGGAAGGGGPEAARASISEFVSFPSPVAALRFLWIGGAFGSLGFLGRRCLAASAIGVPSGLAFGFTVLPGLRPGFLRGTPAAVSCTPGGCSEDCCVCMMPKRAAEPGSTMISSISIFALPALITLVGDVGSDRPDGGDDSDGEEL